MFLTRLAATLLLIATSSGSAQPPQQVSVLYRWTPVRIVAGGYVTGIVFHPKQQGLAYARTDIGGAYRWDFNAERWIPLTDWIDADHKNELGVEGLAIDPNDPQRLFLAVGERTASWAPNGELLRSNDQGRTFEHTPLPFKLGGNEEGRASGDRLTIDPGNGNVLYLGTRHDGLWRSTDAAVTWKKIDSFPALPDNGVGILATIPIVTAGTAIISGGNTALSKTVYAAASVKDGGLYRSDDAGQSWQRVPKQPTGLLITNTAIASNGFLYLTYGSAPGPMDETDGAVWRFELSSGKWTEITPAKPGVQWPDGTKASPFGYGGVTVSSSHPDVLLVSTLNRWEPGDAIFRSTDGGKHWIDIAGGQQPRFAGLSPWLSHTRLVHGAGVWPTTLALDPFDDNHVLYATGETVWETKEANAAQQNHPVRWTVGANGIEETAAIVLLSPPVGAHLFSGVGDIGGFRHDDLNLSPRGGSFKNPELASTSGMAFAAKNPASMVRVGGSYTGTVFGATSQDSGTTWTPFATQPPNTRGSGSVAISADGKVILWASEQAAVATSRDSGKTWTALANLPANARVVADPVNAAKLYLYGPAEGTVMISTDAGFTFKPYANGLPKAELYQQPNIYSVPDREGDLWVGSEAGLFHSNAPGQPFVKVTSVEMIHSMGFGKGANGQAYPTIFAFGRVQGLLAMFGSTDDAKSWIRIDDDAHRFGDIRCITGDPRLFGRVYAGSEGRGIFYADPMRMSQPPATQ